MPITDVSIRNTKPAGGPSSSSTTWSTPSARAAFGSKEELFRQAVRHYGATEKVEIWGGMAQAKTVYEAIECYLMQTARVFTRRSRPPGCMVVLSGLHPNEHSDAVRHELINLRAQNVEDLKQRLQQGVAAGEISPKADLAAIARYYVTLQQGMSIQARDGAGRRELEAVARAALASWISLTGASEKMADAYPAECIAAAGSLLRT
jgi:AcrR family transcriptional regulator